MDYVPLSQHMAQKALGTPISIALSRRRREGRSTMFYPSLGSHLLLHLISTCPDLSPALSSDAHMPLHCPWCDPAMCPLLLSLTLFPKHSTAAQAG